MVSTFHTGAPGYTHTGVAINFHTGAPGYTRTGVASTFHTGDMATHTDPGPLGTRELEETESSLSKVTELCVDGS